MDAFSIEYEVDGKIVNEIVWHHELNDVIDKCKAKQYRIVNVTHA